MKNIDDNGHIYSDETMTLIGEIAENTGYDESEVGDILNESLLQLHKRLYEYKGQNGDYLAEELLAHIDDQAYFHLLGFLNLFSSKYSWDEPGCHLEYLYRQRTRSTWLPFIHQTSGWKEKSR